MKAIEFAIALRNLQRNRRRSLTTLVAMVLGMVAVLLFGGYIRDLAYGLQTDYVNRTGHLQLQRQGYHLYGSGNPIDYGIERYEDVLALLRADPVLAPMLVVATPTLQFGAIAGNFGAGVSRTVQVSGTVVADEARMLAWNDYGLPELKAPLTLAGSAPDAAVIGTGVARVLHLCAPLKVADCEAQAEPAPAGDAALPDDLAALAGKATPAKPTAAGAPRIELLAASSRGAPNVGSVQVVRAEYQGVKEVDDIYVALHLGQAQKLVFGNGPARATAIALQLRHTAQMDAARARLDELLRTRLADRKLEVLDYETINPFYGQTLAMFASIFGFMAVLIGAVVLFTISNTMSMTVVERTVEIGTVRAIGLRRRGVLQGFLIEAVALGGVGAVVGVLLAMALAAAINLMGLTWLPPGRIEPVPLTVRVAGEWAMILGCAATLVLVTVLSALLPASRAANLNIVEALRHV
ncbi:MAG TPA: FtsX-like permease family protein [Burkholderiaceae bacterium]|nr:FtsX-like permease family protein [Burkholderiaceae bacterium]